MEQIIPLVVTLLELFSKLLGNKNSNREDIKRRWEIYHNLPKPISNFIGRREDKERVHQALHGPFGIISIEGIGGVGKSTLATTIAHECMQVSQWHKFNFRIARFRGFIWTTAKGRELSLNAVLDTIAITLKQDSIIQQSIETKEQFIRGLLEKRAYLLIIDNFETIKDNALSQFVNNIPLPSKVLITTRARSFLNATPVTLGDLKQDEAIELIRSEVSRLGLSHLSNAQESILLPIFHATGGTPLAIKWAIGQIKQKGQSLETILVTLRSAKGDIFEQIFARSWELLSEDGRTILTVFPLFAAPPTYAILQATSNLETSSLDEALGQLVEMSLVDDINNPLTEKRYSIHPLTRAFSLAKLNSKPQEKQNAIKQAAIYFNTLMDPYKDFRYLGNIDYALIDPEIPNLFRMIDYCLNKELYEYGKDIFGKLLRYLFIRGYWNDIVDIAARLANYALSMGDEVRWARYQVWPISSIFRHRGQYDEATNCVNQAIDIFTRHKVEKHKASALRHQGRIYHEERQFDEAERCLMKAYDFYLNDKHKKDDWDTLVVALNLAELAVARNNPDDAEKWHKEAMNLLPKFNDPEREASLRIVKAQIEFIKENLVEARKEINKGLEIMRNLNRLDGIADALYWSARIKNKANDKKNAHLDFSEALTIYGQMGIKNKAIEIEKELNQLNYFRKQL